jgi:Holliday junction resolvasome RuvABC DNA-binding subunit
MSHPFEKMFEQALRKSTPTENKVLAEAEALRKKGYSVKEIYDVLAKLQRELLNSNDAATVDEAVEEFRTYIEG